MPHAPDVNQVDPTLKLLQEQNDKLRAELRAIRSNQEQETAQLNIGREQLRLDRERFARESADVSAFMKAFDTLVRSEHRRR